MTTSTARSSADGLTCDDCGAGPFGNGRALNAHRVGAHIRPAAQAARRAPAKAEDISGLQQTLAQDIARIGMYAQLAFPLAGLVLMTRAERAAASMCALARTNTALLKLLRSLTQTTVYAELGFVVGDVVIAMGVERGVIPVESVLTAGIREEINAVLAQQEAAQQQAENGASVNLDPSAATS